jgi:hypothetical protein
MVDNGYLSGAGIYQQNFFSGKSIPFQHLFIRLFVHCGCLRLLFFRTISICPFGKPVKGADILDMFRVVILLYMFISIVRFMEPLAWIARYHSA